MVSDSGLPIGWAEYIFVGAGHRFRMRAESFDDEQEGPAMLESGIERAEESVVSS